MKIAMSTMGKFSFLVFTLAVPVLAQNLQTQPSPAASGPAYDLSVGYTDMKMPIPGASKIGLNGVDFTGGIDFRPHFGVTVDSTLLHTGNLFGTPHSGTVMTLLTGPVFYPLDRQNTRMFVHVLGGLGLIDGAAATSPSDYYSGWLMRFAYAAGAGVEQAVKGPFSLRLTADFLRTDFYNPTGAVLPQNNLRATASIVYRLRERQHRVVAR
jgi:hypothetical protein